MIDEGVPDCLILASGLSRRLGYDKATIQLGETTLLSAMIETMKDHGMKTCVVIGPTSDEEGSSDSVIFVRNENPDHGRTGSIQVGLEALGWPERVIVAPVDRPGFSSRTLKRLFSADSSASPEKQGRGGHPVFLDDEGVMAVRDAHPDSPLNSLIDFSRFEVDDPYLHLNVDTSEDVMSLKMAWGEISDSWKVNPNPE